MSVPQEIIDQLNALDVDAENLAECQGMEADATAALANAQSALQQAASATVAAAKTLAADEDHLITLIQQAYPVTSPAANG